MVLGLRVQHIGVQEINVAYVSGRFDEIMALGDERLMVKAVGKDSLGMVCQKARDDRHGIGGDKGRATTRMDVRPQNERQETLLG